MRLIKDSVDLHKFMYDFGNKKKIIIFFNIFDS